MKRTAPMFKRGRNTWSGNSSRHSCTATFAGASAPVVRLFCREESCAVATHLKHRKKTISKVTQQWGCWALTDIGQQPQPIICHHHFFEMDSRSQSLTDNRESLCKAWQACTLTVRRRQWRRMCLLSFQTSLLIWGLCSCDLCVVVFYIQRPIVTKLFGCAWNDDNLGKITGKKHRASQPQQLNRHFSPNHCCSSEQRPYGKGFGELR